MIGNFFLFLGWAIGNTIVAVFPAYEGMPDAMQDSLDFLASFVAQVGDIFPTSHMFVILTSILTIEGGIMAFTTLAWLFHWRQK